MYSNKIAISLVAWTLSLCLHVFRPFPAEIENRMSFIILKAILYQAFLIEVFDLKYKKHRISLTPFLINLALRNFTEHIIFGIFRAQLYIDLIHTSWFLIDTFKFFHILLNNRATGILKYCISIPIFIFHGGLECISIYSASKKLYFPFKYFLLLFLIAYIVSIKIVIKYRICQFLWYKKSKSNKAKD